MSQQFIYTLFSGKTASLASELWYVGRTSDILTRLNRHQNGSGAKCLQGRKNVVLTRLEKETPFLELVRTLELMKEHGPDQVRGGPFCNRVHSSEDLEMIQKLLESESFGRSESAPEKVMPSVPASPSSSDHIIVASPVTSDAESETLVEPPAKRSKVGTKWTSEDLEFLDTSLRAKQPTAWISERLGRTVGSIESRSRSLIMSRSQRDGFSAAAAYYGRSEKILREYLSCERSNF